MGGKTAIALGLVSGLLVGGLLVGTVIALAPGPVAPAPAESPAAPTPMPEASTPSTPPTAASTTGSSAGPSASPSAGSTDATQAFGIGEPAPPLQLPLVGGETVDLADYAGSPVWVNFMATWCPSCVDELPSMAGFLARYEDTGLIILTVDVREDEPTVQAYFQDLGVYFPAALDANGAAQAAWGALALPVHYWIDADGIVRDGALGGIGPDVMARGLQSILPGVTVTP